MTAHYAKKSDSMAISAPNRLVVSFKSSYTLHKESCEKPERKTRIEQALMQVTGQSVHVDFKVIPDDPGDTTQPKPVPSYQQRNRDKAKHPMVKEAIEMFEAEITRREEPPRTGSSEPEYNA